MNLRQHLPEFLKYLASGFTAAGVDLGSFKILLMFLGPGMEVTAAAISGFLGIMTVFLLNKYFVFQKRERTLHHAVRYGAVQLWNYVAQVFVVYLFVDVIHAHVPIVQAIFDQGALVGSILGIAMFAKIAGIGMTVSWNFLIYKYLVYV